MDENIKPPIIIGGKNGKHWKFSVWVGGTSVRYGKNYVHRGREKTSRLRGKTTKLSDRVRTRVFDVGKETYRGVLTCPYFTYRSVRARWGDLEWFIITTSCAGSSRLFHSPNRHLLNCAFERLFRNKAPAHGGWLDRANGINLYFYVHVNALLLRLNDAASLPNFELSIFFLFPLIFFLFLNSFPIRSIYFLFASVVSCHSIDFRFFFFNAILPVYFRPIPCIPFFSSSDSKTFFFGFSFHSFPFYSMYFEAYPCPVRKFSIFCRLASYRYRTRGPKSR